MNALTIKYKRILMIAFYGISYALVPLIIGIVLASNNVNLHISGDFWATMSGVLFLSNVFGFGSERLIMIYTQRFRSLYAKSFKINLLSLIKFFLVMFVIIGIVTLVVDLFVYILLLNKFDILPHDVNHPILLCFFCIFFFMTSRFMGAFLQGEGFQSIVMQYSIYTNITRVTVIYFLVHNSLYFETFIGREYDLVFTLCLVLSLTEIVRIIGYSIKIISYLSTIPYLDNTNIDSSWKKHLWYFGLYSLQYDWLVVLMILVEIFGSSEAEPAVIGYLIGIIRVFYLIGFITQQITRLKIMQLLSQQKALVSYLFHIAKILGAIMCVVLIITFIISSPLLQHYHITQYLPQLLILVVIAAFKSFSEAVFVNLILTTISKVISWFVYGSSLIFFGFIICIINVSKFGISNVLDSFIIFYALIAVFELIYGVVVLRALMRNKSNYTLLAM